MSDFSSHGPRAVEDLGAVAASLRAEEAATEHRGSADLAALLREERVTPKPAAGQRLDERLENHLRGQERIAPPRRRFRCGGARLRPRWPALGAVACLLVASVLVFDQVRTDEDSVPGGTATRSGEESAGRLGDKSAATDSAPRGPLAATKDGEARLGLRTDVPGPKLVERSAFLALVTEAAELANVTHRIAGVTTAAGGYVATSTIRSGPENRSRAQLELRVPAARLSRTLAVLSRLGLVSERRRSTRDPSAEIRRAALRSFELYNERQRLLRALKRTGTPEEATAIRARLRAIRRHRAVLRAEAHRLRHRIEFARISVVAETKRNGNRSGGDGE